MKFKIFALVLLTVVSSSCKKDGSGSDTTPQAAENNDPFKVAFDLKIKENDNMCLYYTLDGSINFTEDQAIWVPVKGGEGVQEVVFTLPEEIIPSLIRVDFGFGKNENQSDVEIQKFKMSYMGKNFEASGPLIFTYFVPFESYTGIVPGTSTLTRLKKDQGSGPILYPNGEALSAKINEITGGQSPE